jgi:hypothetical protein
VISLKRRERRKKRVSTEVVVMLSGQNGVSRPEWAWTENISARGARILTTHHWRPNDSLLIRCVDGTLRARGRVIYRQGLRDDLPAIGVKLMALRGSWKESSEVQPSAVMAVAS